MAWLLSLGNIARIIMLIMGAIGVYYMYQWGSAITQGVQQAAPGIGAMVGAIGMIFALMPIIMMMMFLFMMMNMFISLFR